MDQESYGAAVHTPTRQHRRNGRLHPRATFPAGKPQAMAPDRVLLDLQLPSLGPLLNAEERKRFVHVFEQALAQAFADVPGTLPATPPASPSQPQVPEIPDDPHSDARTTGRLPVRLNGRLVLVRLTKIDWIEAADNHVNLHLGAQRVRLRRPISRLASELPGEQFLRISRSTIVNLERVEALQRCCHGDYDVILSNGVRLTLSRGYREARNRLKSR